MFDRASTFAHPEIVALLKTKFIPVAIDQAYQRRQQDTEGEFYRKIAGQGPRKDFVAGTTQGHYIATASGQLLVYFHNRDPAKLLGLMQQKLKEFQTLESSSSSTAAIYEQKEDPRFNVKPPEGGIVVRVRAKVLGGYEPASDPVKQIFRSALSRDNLWVSKSERQALAQGKVPETLQHRIARFHLVDNTRGEPPMWTFEEIREIEMTLDNGQLSGRVRLATMNGDRGYEAKLKGYIDIRSDAVVRFDIVALGEFWGEGAFTRGAPRGKFPLAVSFSLADGTEVADSIPPQGSRGWLPGYLP